MRNIPKSILLNENIKTKNYQKIAKNTKKFPKLFTNTNLHRYLTHTHTPKLNSVQYFFFILVFTNKPETTKRPAPFQTIFRLYEAFPLSLSLPLPLIYIPFSLIPIKLCQRNVYLWLTPTHSHTESKGNQRMLNFCVVNDIYIDTKNT